MASTTSQPKDITMTRRTSIRRRKRPRTRHGATIAGVVVLALVSLHHSASCFHHTTISQQSRSTLDQGIPFLHIRRHSTVAATAASIKRWQPTTTATATGRSFTVHVSQTTDDRIGSRREESHVEFEGNNNNYIEITSKLQSYVYNLQRKSSMNNSIGQGRDNNNNSIVIIKNNKSNNKQNGNSHMDRPEIKAAWSLVYFLTNHSVDLQTLVDLDDLKHHREDLVNLLERCVTQAIRRAGEGRDYKLILKLIDASVQFADRSPVLTPRIFGEAIEALSQRTDANVAKIKSVWIKMVSLQQQENSLPSYLTSHPTAYEFNIYLKALVTRGKFTACVDTFRHHTDRRSKKSIRRKADSSAPVMYIQPDAYTASILFSMLGETIRQGQDPVVMSASEEDVRNDNDESLRSKLESISSWSTCWQWNVAMDIIDSLEASSAGGGDDIEGKRKCWNNHAYSSLLSLQAKAQDVFGSGRGHNNGPQLTMVLLDDMVRQEVMPDVVTCTLAMKSLGDFGKELSSGDGTTHSQQSHHNLAVDFLRKMRSDSRLPNPNTQACTAAISACARQGDHTTALELLEEMRASVTHPETQSMEQPLPQPNTWTYNAVLSALDVSLTLKQYPGSDVGFHRQKKKDRKEKRGERVQQALSLLEQMKCDHSRYQMDTIPDTVTYNTILGMGPFSETDEPSFLLSLIDEMEACDIVRDECTYRSSILSSTSSAEALAVIERCLRDRRLLTNDSMTSILNVGLSCLSSRRDSAIFKTVLSKMHENHIAMTVDTVKYLIQILSKCGYASKLDGLLALLSVAPPSDAYDSSKEVLQLIGLGSVPLLPTFNPSEVRAIYTETISACLLSSNFKNAHRMLSMMRESGLQPSLECLEMFASTYAQSCLMTAPKLLKGLSQQGGGGDDEGVRAQHRALNAYKIIMTMVESKPRLKVVGKVAKACARVGQWEQARSLLKVLHAGVIERNDAGNDWDVRTAQGIKATHGYMLRQCTEQRNITAALWFANDIQSFGKSMSQEEERNAEQAKKTRSLSEDRLDHPDGIFPMMGELTTATDSAQHLIWGMKFDDWISLIKAASKTGYWRIAVTSLQQLRSYVERTKLMDVNDDEKAYKLLNDRYNQLVPALVATVICLEREGQYAWALRVITDWVSWSGRKPRVDAVLSAVRVLAANGLGDEIKELLMKCTSEELSDVTINKEVGYDQMLYAGAVTSLHVNGVYDAADEVYMAGVTSSILSFDFTSNGGKFVLDLHGLNVALAHSAVRVALRQSAVILVDEKDEENRSDLMIITGRGRNSAIHLRPILRPQVQNMLTEEFYPSLNSFSVPGNTGCLIVPWQDVLAWQSHQQEQKGVRMLALASLLKQASSPHRLRRSIALTMKGANIDEGDT
jgi:pentatricopeptide repeat protein